MSEATLLDSITFDEWIKSHDGIVLFHKKLCPHCKVMRTVLDKATAERPDIQLAVVDSEEQPDLMARCSVERVPTLIVCRNGAVAARKSGIMNPRELLAFYRVGVMNGQSDILIIGGGIGGMTAALYAARANLSVRIVEKEVCGGLVNWTHTVENVPSYKSIHGMDLMTACREHVESLGVTIEEVNEVEEVRLVGQPKEVRTSEGDSFTADVVVIATGRKPIPLPVETAFEKIHYCSVCDGTAYKDKDVLVVGGGNSGFDESLYLAGLGVRSIHIVEMFPACAAAQSTQDRALATGIIRASVNTTITALKPLPDGRCRASLKDTASGAASEETVDGVFCFIGQKPNTALFEGLIDMEKGYIRTDEDMRTSLPGVFAVGDVRAKRYRQITTAMGDGTIAALEAERFIRSLR